MKGSAADFKVNYFGPLPRLSSQRVPEAQCPTIENQTDPSRHERRQGSTVSDPGTKRRYVHKPNAKENQLRILTP